MKQEVITFPSMHADHRHWQSEHSIWCDDIERWRAQQENALAQLVKLQDIIRDHGKSLNDHADAIARHERSLGDHEKSMARYQREGADAEGQEAMVVNHRQQSGGHEEQRTNHERLKQFHYTLLGQLAALKTVVESAT